MEIISIVNIIAIVVSPILALLISNWFQDKKSKHNEKLWILKTLMVQRASQKNIDYVNALNLIDIVFVDSPKVLEAYDKLYKEYATTLDLTKENNRALFVENTKRAETKLIEAIITNIGYRDKITWDRIQQPYIPQWLVDESKARTEFMDAQTHVANIVNTLVKSVDETKKENN